MKLQNIQKSNKSVFKYIQQLSLKKLKIWLFKISFTLLVQLKILLNFRTFINNEFSQFLYCSMILTRFIKPINMAIQEYRSNFVKKSPFSTFLSNFKFLPSL